MRGTASTAPRRASVAGGVDDCALDAVLAQGAGDDPAATILERAGRQGALELGAHRQPAQRHLDERRRGLAKRDDRVELRLLVEVERPLARGAAPVPPASIDPRG